MTNKIYLIGSRHNQIDSILVLDKRAEALLSFETLEKAKASFRHAYDVLSSPSFTPSDPPSKEELLYHREFMRLINIAPVILEFNQEDCSKILNEWVLEGPLIFRTRESFYNIDHWHCTMKEGFLKKFQVLDIVKDIENSEFIGPDGKPVIRINQVSFLPPADQS